MLLDDLQQRQLLAQISDREGLTDHLAGGRRSVYIGFDPTAPSLHVGNLIPLLALRRVQLFGHRPIVLVGGATGLVGDPSGKTNERQLTDMATAQDWTERIRQQVSRFVDTDGAHSAQVVNNLDWTRELTVIDFLREIGKQFSVNTMTQREFVRTRLEREDEGISYTEFSYMLLQAYDFLELNRRYDCTVQLGGTDQWGNMVSGMDLIRRVRGRSSFVATLALLTRSDGTKFGKTAGGAVWLNPQMTSPYTFYQFWLNASDEDTPRFLDYFTFLSAEERTEIVSESKRYPERRIGQRALARSVTELVHGREHLSSAERISQALFGGDVQTLTEEDLGQLAQDGLDTSVMATNASVVEAAVVSGLAKSRSAARQLIASGGLSSNDQVVSVDHVLNSDNSLQGAYHLLRRGKKTWRLIRMKT